MIAARLCRALVGEPYPRATMLVRTAHKSFPDMRTGWAGSVPRDADVGASSGRPPPVMRVSPPVPPRRLSIRSRQ